MSTIQGQLEAEIARLLARVEHLEAEVHRSEDGGALSPASLCSLILEHAPLIVWSIDREGVLLHSAGSGLAELGLKPGEVVGQNIFEMNPNEPELLDHLQRALRGEQHQATITLRGVVYDSAYFPQWDSSGNVQGVLGLATVVRRQVVAEIELRKSEDRFHKTFHRCPAGMLIVRLQDARILEANASFRQLTGYRSEELAEEPMGALPLWFEPEDGVRLMDLLARKGQVRRRELQFRTRGGELRVAQISTEMIEWEGEECVLVLCEDATAQRTTEDALDASRRRFETLARVAPVGIFYASPDGVCTEVNQFWTELSGMSREETLAGGWVDALHPDDREGFVSAWTSASVDRRRFSAEARVRRSSGEYAWVLVQVEPEFRNDGGLEGFIGTLTDISASKEIEAAQRMLNEELQTQVQASRQALRKTSQTLQEQILERRRTLEELESSRAWWQSLAENAGDHVMVVSPEGIIKFITRTLPDLTHEEVIGRPVYDFLPPEEHEVTRQGFEEVIRTRRPLVTERPGRGTGNTIAWYRSRTAPIIQNERVEALTVVATDITRQREIEEQARQRQAELEHVSRLTTMGGLAAILAHEINQPLAAITNYASGCALRLQSGQGPLDEVVAAIFEIRNQGQRASETIRRMRSFLQKREITREPVNLHQVIDDALALLQPHARAQSVRLHYERSESLPRVIGDSIQLSQVVVNLVMNGIESVASLPKEGESSAEGRSVTITASSAPSDEEGSAGQRSSGPRPEERLLVTVRDTGAGLPADFHTRLGQAFQTTKPNGLGIGLHISRTILEAHGGRLSAEPGESCGAVFSVSLPVWNGKADDE